MFSHLVLINHETEEIQERMVAQMENLGPAL
jgi:hypothetical protein